MRTALITGGVSGIGAATATRLKADGVRVITLDIAAGADLVVDVTDAEAVRSAVAGAGPIDILVNSAGIVGPNMPLWEVPPDGWRRTLGKELATSGVLVNAIAPAVIETPMNADTAPEALAHITSLIPMRRVGRPEEAAELIAWLASDKVSFSTGAVYDLSGGRATY
jgi:NAD(P)-dependent dehydrogenase (short-subunit alcohol dehydrogenase family)